MEKTYLEKLNPHIVRTRRFGAAICDIADDAVAKTPEEKQSVMDEMCRAGWPIVIKARKRGVDI